MQLKLGRSHRWLRCARSQQRRRLRARVLDGPGSGVLSQAGRAGQATGLAAGQVVCLHGHHGGTKAVRSTKQYRCESRSTSSTRRCSASSSQDVQCCRGRDGGRWRHQDRPVVKLSSCRPGGHRRPLKVRRLVVSGHACAIPAILLPRGVADTRTGPGPVDGDVPLRGPGATAPGPLRRPGPHMNPNLI